MSTNTAEKYSTNVKIPFPLPYRTDIYCFGRVGSGKTALMAAILYQIWKSGKIEMPGLDHPKGRDYTNELIGYIRDKKRIDSTPDTFINYMLCDFFDQANRKHPLTFFEMSGEIFRNIYIAGNNFKNDISLPVRFKHYLGSENKKVLLFTIGINSNYFDEYDTVDKVLKVFETNKGILDKTKAVALLITKWDQYPDNASPDAPKRFIDNELKNLDEIITRLAQTKKFIYEKFTFSVGNCTGNICTHFAPENTEMLLNWLCSFTDVEKKDSWSSSVKKYIKFSS